MAVARSDSPRAGGGTFSLVGLVRRRWPLVLVLLLLAACSGIAVTKVVPPDYETKASVVLVPPESRENPTGNRYLLLGGLTPARDVVIRSLSSAETHQRVVADSPGADYVVEPDFTTSAPLVLITATADTPASSKAVLAALVAQMPKTLAALQDELRTQPGARITSLVISQDSEAARVGKKQIRAMLAAVGGLLVLGMIGIGLIDGLRERAGPRADTDPRESTGTVNTLPLVPKTSEPVRPAQRETRRLHPAVGADDPTEPLPSSRRGRREQARVAGSDPG